MFQIARETFTDTVNKINELFERAEELGCPTYTEGCLSCMTGYLLYFCIETKYSKVRRNIFIVLNSLYTDIVMKFFRIKCVFNIDNCRKYLSKHLFRRRWSKFLSSFNAKMTRFIIHVEYTSLSQCCVDFAALSWLCIPHPVNLFKCDLLWDLDMWEC